MATNQDTNMLKYTSRDYNSIKSDLLSAINAVTSNWTSREESDPGIILLNLMSYLGDNLSFNLDMEALEMYLPTVTQRKNIKKILELLGYNLHWYRSGIVDVTIYNNTENLMILNTNLFSLDDFAPTNRLNSVSGNVNYLILPVNPASTQLTDDSGNINYNNGNFIRIEGYDSYTLTAVQGSLQRLIIGYSDINNDIFYIPNNNVDEAHLYLYSIYSDETKDAQYWELVSDISLQETGGRYFEFDTDEYDRPFIKLPNYWKSYYQDDGSSSLVLYYILSVGANGNVPDNAFYSITNPPKQYNGSEFVNATNYQITNNNNWEAIYGNNYPGYNPQTTDEARSDAKNYINTYNTLVTISDFEKFVKQQPGFNASLAIDVQRAYDLNENIFENISVSTDTTVDMEHNADRIKQYVCGYGKVPSVENLYNTTDTDVPEYTYSKITEDTLEYYVPNPINTSILNEDTIDKYCLNIYCIYQNFDETYLGVDSDSDWNNPTNTEYTDKNGNRFPGTANIVYPYRRYIVNDDVLYGNGDAVSTRDGLDGKFSSAKILNVKINYATCRVFDWRAVGTIYLRKPVTAEEAELIKENVINVLAKKFTADYVGFGQRVSYMDVIETIQNADSRIRYFDAGKGDKKLIDWNEKCFNYKYFNPISIMRFYQYSVPNSYWDSVDTDTTPKFNQDEDGIELLSIDSSCIIG